MPSAVLFNLRIGQAARTELRPLFSSMGRLIRITSASIGPVTVLACACTPGGRKTSRLKRGVRIEIFPFTWSAYMHFSIRRIIRVLAFPHHRVSMSRRAYEELREGLALRAGNRRESGAFLLGNIVGGRREVTDFVFYEELDPRAYDTGAITLDSSAYVPLFNLCRTRGVRVVADVHVHPGYDSAATKQSSIDQANPMLSEAGHVAIIVNHYATAGSTFGVHEYVGSGHWRERDSGFFYIGVFGP